MRYVVIECYCTHPATEVAQFRSLADALAYVRARYGAEANESGDRWVADVTVEGCEPSVVAIEKLPAR